MKINIIKNHAEIDEMHKLIWEECKKEIEEIKILERNMMVMDDEDGEISELIKNAEENIKYLNNL